MDSELTAAMEVDNQEGMSMSLASMTPSEWAMDVENNFPSPPSIVPDHDIPDTQLEVDANVTQISASLSSPPLLTHSGRPQWEYRLPKRFCDNIPEPPAPVPTAPLNPDPNPHPLH